MIVFLILGGIFIIVGYIMGVRKFIKAYQYRGKAEGVILDYENSTGTGKQSIRVRYQYKVSGVEYIATECVLFARGSDHDFRDHITGYHYMNHNIKKKGNMMFLLL